MSKIPHEYYQRWDTATFLPSPTSGDSWLLRSCDAHQLSFPWKTIQQGPKRWYAIKEKEQWSPTEAQTSSVCKGWKSLRGSWAGHQKQRFRWGGKVSRYLYQICWIFLEASAWRNLLQDLWCCGMSAQSNSKALPHPLLLWVYLTRRHSQTESK